MDNVTEDRIIYERWLDADGEVVTWNRRGFWYHPSDGSKGDPARRQVIRESAWETLPQWEHAETPERGEE